MECVLAVKISPLLMMGQISRFCSLEFLRSHARSALCSSLCGSEISWMDEYRARAYQNAKNASKRDGRGAAKHFGSNPRESTWSLTMSTPPPTHPPPSLPTSPLAKRPKTGQSPATGMVSSSPNGAPERAPASAPPPPLSASPPLLVKKLSPQARTPTRGSAFAAGYDLYSAKDCSIPRRGKGLVDTDISIAVGEGCCESFPLTHA